MELARAAPVTRELAANHVDKRRAVSCAGRRVLEVLQLLERDLGDRDAYRGAASAALYRDRILSRRLRGIQAGFRDLSGTGGAGPLERAVLGVKFQMFVGGAGGKLGGSAGRKFQFRNGGSGGVAHGDRVGRCDRLNDRTAGFLFRGRGDGYFSAALRRGQDLSV